MAGWADARASSPSADPRRWRAGRISVQLQSTNAQTPHKTREDQTPESKTNQQLRQPCGICKTSIPGSNPGGASKFLRRINALLVPVATQAACSQVFPSYVPPKIVPRSSQTSDPRHGVVRSRRSIGRRFREPLTSGKCVHARQVSRERKRCRPAGQNWAIRLARLVQFDRLVQVIG